MKPKHIYRKLRWRLKRDHSRDVLLIGHAHDVRAHTRSMKPGGTGINIDRTDSSESANFAAMHARPSTA